MSKQETPVETPAVIDTLTMRAFDQLDQALAHSEGRFLTGAASVLAVAATALGVFGLGVPAPRLRSTVKSYAVEVGSGEKPGEPAKNGTTKVLRSFPITYR
jgi:hypothetical protein